MKEDPYLRPYMEDMRRRAERADDTARRLVGPSAQALSEWAAAHEYYGLHRTPGGWTFREWAPNATEMHLVGDFSGWREIPAFRCRRLAGTGDWECEMPEGAVRHGQNYNLSVKWDGGGGERIPSCARYVVQDPKTNLFCARVYAPERPYEWRNESPAAVCGGGSTPLIYEAHVGMSGEDARVSTYAEFRDNVLPRIRRAGYNTVQLMGIMEHPYYGSFGYHVSSFFAASSRFGTPDDLKSLVDAAHGMGLRVVMDIVHSHAVKNERDGLSRFDGTEHQYFHAGRRGWHPAWGSRCFDYGKTQVLHFLLSNCRFWLDEYRFDGYRFDGVTSMLYFDHGLGRAFCSYADYFDGSVDEDAWAYLRLANRVVHESHPSAITIAEDVSGIPGCASPDSEGGLGFDYRMAMGEPDKWFHLAGEERDEDWSMGGLYHALVDRRAEEKVVSYVESHDQALVGGKTFLFQLADAALYTGMARGQHSPEVDRAVALHKMARFATCALNGGAYLNFMGNEFGHPEWIDFPREGNGFSYAHARRQWSLRDDPGLRFRELADFDEAMLAALSRSGAFGAEPRLVSADEGDKVLAFARGRMLFAFNFNPSKSFTDYGLLVPPASRWRHVLDTDEPRFGGWGRIAAGEAYAEDFVRHRGELVRQARLYLPARTAAAFELVGGGE